MFHIFSNQKERLANCSSAFIELQYCKMKAGTPAKIIVSVSSINHWQDDSLYINIDNIDDFLDNYCNIFKYGLYSNLQRGMIDLYGINYYSPAQVLQILSTVEEKKPVDYAMLRDWLNKASVYNGIYILGI
ncbi:MAG TPA: hypothetical protein GXX20_00370 [Clostridiaceae bacterium]|nr:hypothetical protein [Clostridiaceae bacterium]